MIVVVFFVGFAAKVNREFPRVIVITLKQNAVQPRPIIPFIFDKRFTSTLRDA